MKEHFTQCTCGGGFCFLGIFLPLCERGQCIETGDEGGERQHAAKGRRLDTNPWATCST